MGDAVPSAFEHALRRRVADVDFSTTARALFASDASNYRIVPTGVVFPRGEADVLAALSAARTHGVSIVPRGGGTSTGGQAVGPGLVVDCSRSFDRVLEIDPDARTARVEPGVVLDDLQAHLEPHGLRFGPDPSTHDRCTVGGMIGNNACGAHSVRFGKTDDNVVALRVATYAGDVVSVSTLDAMRGSPVPPERALAGALSSFVERYADVIRHGMGPPMPRRVSGYGLSHLLPEHGGHVARALVGTEGTCVALLDATLALVDAPNERSLVTIGFRDLYDAADFVPKILAFAPLTVEGLDARLVALARSTNESAPGAALLPDGNGWLLVEIGGSGAFSAHAVADAIADDALVVATSVLTDHGAQRQVWRLREDGAGLATRLADGSEAWPGWEDAAVPPERLGDYLRRFDALLADHGYRGVHYGHYGEGCLHIRIDFDFGSSDGRARFRRFIEAAADLVVEFGGSLSGEHGDGQARSELLGKMYPPEVLEAFAAFKAIFDPDDRMNPGRIVTPRAFDADLRVRAPRRPIARTPGLALRADDGDLDRGARRCVGVGKCRRREGGAMCPSFQVTRDERDSTRGRARLLSEMFAGDLVTEGWRSREVHDALDLCLGCKACASDCPVAVDMATYKVEFLSHHFAGRLRPRSHYALGNLPRVLGALGRAPRLANLMLASPVGSALKPLAGIDRRRAFPALAPRPRRRRREPASPTAVVFGDTFTSTFSPQVIDAAVDVLGSTGDEVSIVDGVCCGLTWYSTGQLPAARRSLRRAVERLGATGDAPIVVLEPSCAAMLRDDGRELLDGADVGAVAERVVSLGAHVDASDVALGDPAAGRIVAQVHCHQRAATGYEAEERMLRRLATEVEFETGCCGLAGNFGFEAGHYELSRDVAARGILSRLDASDNEVRVVADGFSCRTQIAELGGVRAFHIAEVLRDAIVPPR